MTSDMTANSGVADQVAIGWSGMRITPRMEGDRRNSRKHLMGPVPGLALLMAVAMPAWAADIAVTMKKATQDGTGETLGKVTISASEPGATFRLDLHGLPPGTHGFHVHQNPTCGPTLMSGLLIPAGAAGDHFDPENTGRHAGASGNGHLGDLPV